MTTPRLILAAVAASFLSTAAFAAPPSADQVTVPQSEMRHNNKLKALFDNQDQFMMFRMEMRQATHGMARDRKKAYRKAEVQKLRVMNASERSAYFHGLQAKWNALPESRRERMVQRMENHAARHQERHGGGQRQGAPNGDQAYPDDGQAPQQDQTR
ncbi:MAG TPA: hypothetical protein VG889_04490 [Rhizomicrobium sp.]|nr:hypothetical protein [Rhizomicrobium sp.]